MSKFISRFKYDPRKHNPRDFIVRAINCFLEGVEVDLVEIPSGVIGKKGRFWAFPIVEDKKAFYEYIVANMSEVDEIVKYDVELQERKRDLEAWEDALKAREKRLEEKSKALDERQKTFRQKTEELADAVRDLKRDKADFAEDKKRFAEITEIDVTQKRFKELEFYRLVNARLEEQFNAAQASEAVARERVATLELRINELIGSLGTALAGHQAVALESVKGDSTEVYLTSDSANSTQDLNGTDHPTDA